MNMKLYLNGNKIDSDVLEYTYYQLKQTSYVIHKGYKYFVDFNQHKDDINYYENIQKELYKKFQHEMIDEEQYSIICDEIMEKLNNYNLIDEDGYICGKYNINTKSYCIYYERIEYKGKIYYISDEMGNTKGIYNCARMCVGCYNENNGKIEFYNETSIIEDNFDE